MAIQNFSDLAKKLIHKNWSRDFIVIYNFTHSFCRRKLKNEKYN